MCAQAAEGKRKRGEGKRERRQVGKRAAEERNWKKELACIFQSNTLGIFKNPRGLYGSPALVIFFFNNSRVLSSLMLSH